MIIIFGFRSFNKNFAEKPEWCTTCKNNNFLFSRRRVWFTLFFIPIIPFPASYSKLCTKCAEEISLKKAMFFSEINANTALPPPPFEGNEILSLNGLEPVREITMIREKRAGAATAKFHYYLDGIFVGTAKNGETVTFRTDSVARSVFVVSKKPLAEVSARSNVVMLESGSENRTFKVEQKGSLSVQITEIMTDKSQETPEIDFFDQIKQAT